MNSEGLGIGDIKGLMEWMRKQYKAIKDKQCKCFNAMIDAPIMGLTNFTYYNPRPAADIANAGAVG